MIATQAVDELQHLRLDGDVERRGWLVGDQQLWVVGKRRGNDDALALAAGETVRHVVVARRRVGDADLAHQRDGSGARLGGAHIAMGADGFGDLVAHRPRRIEAGGWVLEDHRHFVAADLPQRIVAKPDDLAAVEQNAAADRGAGGQQAHHRVGQRALAASALADDSEDLAGLERERDRSDSRRRLNRIARAEADADVGEGEDGAHSATPSRVENPTQPFAEESEAEHRDDDRETWVNLDPRRLDQHLAAIGQHAAQAKALAAAFRVRGS